MPADGRGDLTRCLTLILLTWRIWWDSNNASRWQMGFNSAFKGLNNQHSHMQTHVWINTPRNSLYTIRQKRKFSAFLTPILLSTKWCLFHNLIFTVQIKLTLFINPALQFKHQTSHLKVMHKYSSYNDIHAENNGLLQSEAHNTMQHKNSYICK